jgi:hypothetical protein
MCYAFELSFTNECFIFTVIHGVAGNRSTGEYFPLNQGNFLEALTSPPLNLDIADPNDEDRGQVKPQEVCYKAQ